MERPARHLRANRGQNPNARWIVDEPIKKKPAKRRKSSGAKRPNSKQARTDEEPIEGTTRCQCEGKVPDTKVMAECENCSTWQHVVCEFGVNDESAVPEPYFCYRCRKNSEEESTEDGEASTSLETAVKDEFDQGAEGDSDSQTTVEEKTQVVEENSIEGIEDKVRRSVAEAWLKILERIKDHSNSELDQNALRKKALELERALFDAFHEEDSNEVSHTYREQFRMLSFNLKDDKNEQLQRRVLSGEIRPSDFVTMSSEDLRNPELQRFAKDVHDESIRESIITETEPPKEKISFNTAEVNAEPAEAEVEREERSNEANIERAMVEPLGPPPPKTSSGSSEEPSIEAPVWEGQLKLADDSISVSAKGMHIMLRNGVKRDAWTKYTNKVLEVQGLSQIGTTSEYLRASAAETKLHTIGAYALVSDDNEKMDELFTYFKNLNRFGAVKHAEPHIKDIFLIPYDKSVDLSFLQLETEGDEFLNHLRIEHNDERLLLAVYVLNVPVN